MVLTNNPKYRNLQTFDKYIPGLSLIHYEPHPTLIDLCAFVQFIGPIHVRSIFTNAEDKVPKVLKNLCRTIKTD